MEALPTDEILLHGKLQVDTAIAALHAVDVNPVATDVLETARNTQRVVAMLNPGQPERINLFFGGAFAATMKADILVGLEFLISQADTPEQKIAAQALLETLRQ